MARGPRLVGEPGSPEFIASYYAAIQSRREPDRATFHRVIAGYKAIQDFLGLSARSQLDYLKQIKKIETKFADLPIAALDDARVTREFLEWRDRMANSPRQADYAWTVLMRVVLMGAGEGTYTLPSARTYRASLSRRPLGKDLGGDASCCVSCA